MLTLFFTVVKLTSQKHSIIKTYKSNFIQNEIVFTCVRMYTYFIYVASKEIASVSLCFCFTLSLS